MGHVETFSCRRCGVTLTPGACVRSRKQGGGYECITCPTSKPKPPKPVVMPKQRRTKPKQPTARPPRPKVVIHREPVVKTCARDDCDTEFSTTRSTQGYCSTRCTNVMAARRMRDRKGRAQARSSTCERPECGASFMTHQSKRKYCSRRCQTTDRARKARAESEERRKAQAERARERRARSPELREREAARKREARRRQREGAAA